MSKEDTLKVEVVDGKLHISIGVNAMCNALEGSWYFQSGPFKITDIDVFTDAVRAQLLAEEEDGTTPVHTMLDSAAEMAIEWGCEGVDFGDDE